MNPSPGGEVQIGKQQQLRKRWQRACGCFFSEDEVWLVETQTNSPGDPTELCPSGEQEACSTRKKNRTLGTTYIGNICQNPRGKPTIVVDKLMIFKEFHNPLHLLTV